jgi:hypothetical protein
MYVAQTEPCGCGAATAAMITGISYQEAKDNLEAGPTRNIPIDWTNGGISHVDLDWILGEFGYFGLIKYVTWYKQRNGAIYTPLPGKVWPPAPFAPIHYAQVVQPNGLTHFVVMQSDATVLDPLENIPKRLTDWPEVHHVVGLLRK